MPVKLIYTTAYPDSGLHHLCRLLSDLFDSPIGDFADGVVTEDFCRSCQGGYAILRTRMTVSEWESVKKLGDKVVFLQRDPRDVMVSKWMSHLDPVSLGSVISSATTKSRWNLLPYGDFVEPWLEEHLKHPDVITTRYEDLRRIGPTELRRISLLLTGIDPTHEEANVCIKCNVPELSAHAGWKRHFLRKHGRLMASVANDLMRRQGYIQEDDWWKDLPE